MTAPAPRLLIVGATGVFGSRLVEQLDRSGTYEFILAGRNAARAEKLLKQLSGRGRQARFEALDRNRPEASRIASLKPLAVIDAAGPFQEADLALPKACIDAGVHYLDLSDARDFVQRIGTLDAAARHNNVAVISGASSTPALSNAVLDSITGGWKLIDHILVAISPGNRAPRGLSVVKAILSYAGKPVRVFREGRWQKASGWSLNEELTFPQLGSRPVALCETPDLDVLVERHAPRVAAEFKAGLELRLMHSGLAMLSRLVSLKLFGSLKPAAPLLLWCANMLKPFGADEGGMVVQVSGLDAEATPRQSRWWLAAKAGLGPNVPVLPAVVIVEGLVSGSLGFRGAGSAAGLVGLDAISAHFKRIGIETGVESQLVSGPDLFEAALGEAWRRLPGITRHIHTVRPSIVLDGQADVDGAETKTGKLIAALFGFPVASRGVPVRVVIERDGPSECWARHYPTRTMRSMMTAADPHRHTVEEHMGPFRFRLKLAASEKGIDLIPEAVSWRGLPLPSWCLPQIAATERASLEGKHLFDVLVSLWPFGRLVHYRGWLADADNRP